MKTMIRLLALYFVLMLTLASCSTKSKSKAKQVAEDPEVFTVTDKQLALMDIRLVKPERRLMEGQLHLSGKVMALPNMQASVSSDIEGKVEQVFVLEGAQVRKGQPLVTLRSMELIKLQKEYLESKSQKDFLEIEYARQKELIRNNVGALSEFQVTEAKYNASCSQLKSLGAQLILLGISPEQLSKPGTSEVTSTLTITSPIDGYVHNLPVTVGMLANTETVLAEIINLNELFATLYAYDKDIDDIKPGQKVDISFVNHDLPKVSGEVSSIERVIDDESKAIHVHVKFNAPDKSFIFHDMNVKAVLKTQRTNAMAHTVLLSSLLQEEDNYYVFCSSPGKRAGGLIELRKCKIQVLQKNESFAEVAFLNEESDFMVAQDNVQSLEIERKKALATAKN